MKKGLNPNSLDKVNKGGGGGQCTIFKEISFKSKQTRFTWLGLTIFRSLRIECVKFFDPNNPDLREFLKNRRTEENRNRVVYNLWIKVDRNYSFKD